MTKIPFIVPPEIKAFLGRPALLSTENPAVYWTTLSEFAETLEPKDALEWISVQTITDEWWETQRARTFKARLIEEGHRREVERTGTGIALTYDLRVNTIQNSADPSSPFTAAFRQQASAESKELDPEEKAKRQQDVDKLKAEAAMQLSLLEKAPTNADFAAAIEHWLANYERVDQLQAAAHRRFMAAREELMHYRELGGAGGRRDDVIDGEFEETTDVSSETGQVAPPPRTGPVVQPAVASGSDLELGSVSQTKVVVSEFPSVELQPQRARDSAAPSTGPVPSAGQAG
jgi:hypothetical protein